MEMMACRGRTSTTRSSAGRRPGGRSVQARLGGARIIKVSAIVMEDDVVSMQDIFVFKQTGVDEEQEAGGYHCTGVRPKASTGWRKGMSPPPDSIAGANGIHLRTNRPRSTPPAPSHEGDRAQLLGLAAGRRRRERSFRPAGGGLAVTFVVAVSGGLDLHAPLAGASGWTSSS